MRLVLMLLLISGICLSSCTKRHVTPTKDSRRAIDTIYQQKILLLKPELDSMCGWVYDSLYPIAVDSILQERQQEMDALVK
jgi:hypothetical protein